MILLSLNACSFVAKHEVASYLGIGHVAAGI